MTAETLPTGANLMSSHILAAGNGWHVHDVVCRAGPKDRPFEERHGTVCIAAVTSGTFQYRSVLGKETLVPGSLLLGNAGHCFECSHEHGTGDRCLSIGFSHELFEEIAAGTPGARQARFERTRVAPVEWLTPHIAGLQSIHTSSSDAATEEIVIALAGAVLRCAADGPERERAPTRAEVDRISDTVRYIEAFPGEDMPLSTLARRARMSRYHFLRVFRRVTGVTPHQFLLRLRVRRAATLLRASKKSVTEIAFRAGFNDLSTFNRSFKRALGRPPSAFRV